MKKLAALAVLATLSFAVRAEGPDWTGFSGGVTLGAVRHTSSFTGNSYDTDRRSADTNTTGILPGLLVGYDWKQDTTILGLELSHEFGVSKKDSSAGSDPAYPIQRTDRLKSLSSLTLRWGLPRGENLYYVRGGVGFVRAEHAFQPTLSSDDDFTATNRKMGALLGIGFERRVADSLFFRAEYIHFQGGSETFTWSANSQPYKTKEKLDTLKVGLSYRF